MNTAGIDSGQVGVQSNNDGTFANMRIGRQSDLIVSELHGKYYENNLRGNLYGFGIANTVLAAVNAVATGLTSTAKPVIGVYNPLNSGKNLVILKASIITTLLANSAVNPGGFTWLVSAAGQSAVSTGSVPWNRFSLAQSGSVAKAFAVSTALTGLVGSLTDTGMPVHAANFTAAGAGTAVSLFAPCTSDDIDGSIIVPPGMVLAAMNLLSTTTVQVASGLLWEEIAV